jgi:hypothetical protein
MHSSDGELDYEIRQPAPRWRVYLTTAAALALIAGVIGLGSGALNPKAANAVITQEDCVTAFGHPDRTQAEKDWLALCVTALRPYVAPTTPPASPSAEPSVSPTGAPTASPSASPTPPATPVETATWTTSGRFLKDPRGVTLVVRGAEQVFWNASWLPTSFVNQIGISGANTIRILPYYRNLTPNGEPRSTLTQIEDMIKRGINSKMLVDVAMDGGSVSKTWHLPEVKALMKKYEKYTVIHAKGESYENSGPEWVTASNSVVAAMRAAGYNQPLYIMSRIGGRDLETILHYGQQIVNADPLHRIVFGWQAYWSPNTYQNSQRCPLVSQPWPSPNPPAGCTLAQAFAAVANAPFPIQVGMIEHADQQDENPATMDWGALMSDAQSKSIGWLWWDWRMGVDDLTYDGHYGHWAHDGAQIVVSHPASIANTSVRTPFQLAQVAPV